MTTNMTTNMTTMTTLRDFCLYLPLLDVEPSDRPSLIRKLHPFHVYYIYYRRVHYMLAILTLICTDSNRCFRGVLSSKSRPNSCAKNLFNLSILPSSVLKRHDSPLF